MLDEVSVMENRPRLIEGYPGMYTVTEQHLSPKVSPLMPKGSIISIQARAQNGTFPVTITSPGDDLTLVRAYAKLNDFGGLQLTFLDPQIGEEVTFVASLFVDPSGRFGAGYKYLYGHAFIGDPQSAGGWGAEGG